ncbi:hypothetical protein SNARM312S_07834 [Streptomyces narbonensis]
MRPLGAARLGMATALAGVFACTSITTAAATDTGTAPARDKAKVITVIGKLAEQTRFPVNPEGPAAQGDRTAFRSDLYDLDDKKIGETAGTCTTTRADLATGGAEVCVVTYTLPGGQLAVQGMVFGHLNPGPPPSFDNAITGGTGQYDRARGSIHADTIGMGQRRFTITIKP